ncbi:MAG: AMP-binding protein, partial [Microvirga sp.]
MAEVGEGGFIERFVALAERDGERDFARFEGETLSFAHLHDQSARIAAGLRRLGVGRGDRVAVMLANSPAALALLFALAKSGAVWVPLNVQLRADGLRYILDHAEPRMVIARADLIPLIRGCGATLPQATLIAEGEVDGVLPLASLAAGPAGFDEELPRPEALFAISYTSGTTGAPKGVLMSHRMLRLAGEGGRLVSDAQDGDVLYMWEPLYHIGGSQLIVLPLL